MGQVDPKKPGDLKKPGSAKKGGKPKKAGDPKDQGDLESGGNSAVSSAGSVSDCSGAGAIDFSQVFAEEAGIVNERRAASGYSVSSIDGSRVSAQNQLVGMSLSGGGIRSAAFCMGVLQALDVFCDLPKKLDYLSTVSGGGYIGCSTVLGMTKWRGEPLESAAGERVSETYAPETEKNAGTFPFKSELGKAEKAPIRHIRDFSNYLVADGFMSLLGSFGAILLGFLCNAIAVFGVLMFLATLTGLIYPALCKLDLPYYCLRFLGLEEATLGTFALGRLFLVAALGFGLLIILFSRTGLGEKLSQRDHWRCKAGAAGLLVALPFLWEINLLGLKWAYTQAILSGGGLDEFSFFSLFSASATAVIIFARGGLEKIQEFGDKFPGVKSMLAKFFGKAVYLLLGLIVPALLWVAYAWMYIGYVVAVRDMGPSDSVDASFLSSVWFWYLIIALALFLAGFFISPNAFSLHALYRDRLSKGFIQTFDVKKTDGAAGFSGDAFKVSELEPAPGEPRQAPYLLVNTALNIQGSRTANRRGRNADFFSIGSRFTGSEATGYCRTQDLEQRDPHFNLATAMATSGAAASANMGGKTIRPLVFSLALLNIRLGYWLPNPGAVTCGTDFTKNSKFGAFLQSRFGMGAYWFGREVLGNLKETCSRVHLTDGGHIENLGIYELLRRRCKLIVAVDGEADPEMNLTSFMALQQHARIDMGIRIDLNWDVIREQTLAHGEGEAQAGPHCALGVIHYEGDDRGEADETGVLVYIKSSLSGDENDYVSDYKRRFSEFPHETTLDQFFSEEQFEVYRALGFHAGEGLCDGETRLQGPNGSSSVKDIQIITQTLQTLLGIKLGDTQLI